MIEVILRPHRDRDGLHHDRFEAWLGDRLVCVSKSGWHAPARALLELGYSPGTLMRVQHAGRPHDLTIVGKPISDYAEWTIKERDRGGLRREKYSQFIPGDARTGADAPAGIILPEDAIAA